jgi:hypothetical protein
MLPLDKIRAEGFNAGIEAAAAIADPPMMHRKGVVGMWRLRRKKIADDIRACKVEFEGS